MIDDKKVTPFVGVWIETCFDKCNAPDSDVTPFVGVWIETDVSVVDEYCQLSHTLRGCVD